MLCGLCALSLRSSDTCSLWSQRHSPPTQKPRISFEGCRRIVSDQAAARWYCPATPLPSTTGFWLALSLLRFVRRARREETLAGLLTVVAFGFVLGMRHACDAD